MNQPPKHKRHWLRFSLKTLMIVMTVATVAFGGWVQYRRQRAQENRERVAKVEEAVAEIQEWGGVVFYEYEELRRQTWLERQFDDPGDTDDPVGLFNVTEVYLNPPHATDADLEHLRSLTTLRELNINQSYGETKVTDAGLEHLKGLKSLRYLHFSETIVTDEGVKQLQQALPKCKIHR